jgi:hypothetical protein
MASRGDRINPSALPFGYCVMPDRPTLPEEVMKNVYNSPDATWWTPQYDNDDGSGMPIVHFEYRCLDTYVAAFVQPLIYNTVHRASLKAIDPHPHDRADIQNDGETCDVKHALKKEEDVKHAVKEEKDIKNAWEQDEDVEYAVKREERIRNAPVRSTTAYSEIKKEDCPTDLKMEGTESSSE